MVYLTVLSVAQTIRYGTPMQRANSSSSFSKCEYPFLQMELRHLANNSKYIFVFMKSLVRLKYEGAANQGTNSENESERGLRMVAWNPR
jgi:hypothetical protein